MNSDHCRIGFAICSFFLGLTVSACASAPTPQLNEQTIADIRAVLEAQQAAWNRGDIDGFMDGYDRAETTTFVSGDESTRGWQTVLNRYKQRYSTREQMVQPCFMRLRCRISAHAAETDRF